MRLENYFRSKLEEELIMSKDLAEVGKKSSNKEIYWLLRLYNFYRKFYKTYGTYKAYLCYKQCSIKIREFMKECKERKKSLLKEESKVDIDVRTIRSIWMKYRSEKIVFKVKSTNKFYNIISSIRTKY
jgi:hypothetical protein